MMGSSDIEELKGLVEKTLESKGILAKIKAQLRASVFTAINEQDRNSGNVYLENHAGKKIQELLEARIALGLICEFLEFYELDYSLAVLQPEAHLSDSNPRLGRDTLAQHLKLKGTTRPLLLDLVASVTAHSDQITSPRLARLRDEHSLHVDLPPSPRPAQSPRLREDSPRSPRSPLSPHGLLPGEDFPFRIKTPPRDERTSKAPLASGTVTSQFVKTQTTEPAPKARPSSEALQVEDSRDDKDSLDEIGEELDELGDDLDFFEDEEEDTPPKAAPQKEGGSRVNPFYRSGKEASEPLKQEERTKQDPTPGPVSSSLPSLRGPLPKLVPLGTKEQGPPHKEPTESSEALHAVPKTYKEPLDDDDSSDDPDSLKKDLQRLKAIEQKLNLFNKTPGDKPQPKVANPVRSKPPVGDLDSDDAEEVDGELSENSDDYSHKFDDDDDDDTLFTNDQSISELSGDSYDHFEDVM